MLSWGTSCPFKFPRRTKHISHNHILCPLVSYIEGDIRRQFFRNPHSNRSAHTASQRQALPTTNIPLVACRGHQ
ncbi:hypothetical protein EI94DRAFT_1714506 [Lactarius quietus]|nr:hypothetical protein EI94DRAFT_1714506 [Lactarius quietus]